MGKDFEKFKKRVWTHILISCAVIAAMAGFLAVVAVLLPCRLFGIKIFWLLYVLIAFGGMALGGGIAFLFLRTDDKKIARRLDSELKLSERVVTAYDYSAYEGAMVEAQREDTANVLASARVNSLSFKNLILTAVCAVLALAFIVAVPVIGVAVPPVFAQAGGEPSEPPRPVTKWEWDALDDLIEYVENSKKADEASKTAMLAQLNGLKNVLLDGVSASSLKNFVESAVINIRNSIRTINGGVAEEQQTANTEESEYVISRLYEIFDMTPAIEGEGEGEGDGNGGSNNDSENDGNGGGTGAGGLNISDLPFFDRELGFVKCGEVRDEYYEKALQALEEGLISGEEWALIMATYFSDLNDKNE